MLNPRQIPAFAPWQDVRFGSLADVVVSRINVRFTPKSGHVRCNHGCLPRAKSGHCAANSITSKLAIMFSIQVCALPQQALLAKYAQGDNYTDCYAAEVARPVSHAEYVEAFYTTALFKLERQLLAWFASRPSTDAQAKELASGVLGAFAAWRVEDRSANQLLMCDLTGRTRSWFMVTAAGCGSSTVTRLYSGSAVVPVVNKRSGLATLGFTFKALLGFHKLYSQALLSAARSRLTMSALGH